MKKIGYLLTSATTFSLPLLASAQLNQKGAGAGEIEIVVDNLVSFINGTLIPAVIALAFLFFVWGVFQFFIAGGADEEKREKGKSLMIYSIIGFVLIVVLWGLVNLIATSFGIDNEIIKVPKTIGTGT